MNVSDGSAIQTNAIRVTLGAGENPKGDTHAYPVRHRGRHVRRKKSCPLLLQ